MPEPLNYNGEVERFLFYKSDGTLTTAFKFLIPWARVGKCRKEAYDGELGKRLWNWLEEEVRQK